MNATALSLYSSMGVSPMFPQSGTGILPVIPPRPKPPAERPTDASIIARCKLTWRETLFARRELIVAYHAEPNRQAVASKYAASLGKSVATLNRMYYAWLKSGIQALVPKSALHRASTEPTRNPPEFIEYFRSIIESCDNTRHARRILLDRIQRGDKIPGYGTWRSMWAAKFPNLPPPQGDGPDYPRDEIEMILPSGLSERTLHRITPEAIELIAARQGPAAAGNLTPMVYTTRVGTRPGQVLFFDDVWHNQNCNYMGSSKALRPIELCCLDLTSAHKVAWGARPRIFNPETRRHETVKDREFRYLLAYTLCEAVGYRKDTGTMLFVERGTASIDKDLAVALKGLSDGKIEVKGAPLKQQRQLCSVYSGAHSGNPRFKAPLESHHNVGHSATSAIVGQIGRSADVRPEEIFGRDDENKLILKLAAVLPPEQAQLLALPYLHWDEYMTCVIEAYDRLAWRTWHQLEGWERCGFHATEFHIPGISDGYAPLSSIQDMPPDAAAAIQAMLDQHPDWCRIRPLAPIEVWNRHKSELTRLPKCAIPVILGPQNGHIRPCPDTAEIAFQSRDLGPDRHIYSREYQDEYGSISRLIAGREYMFHINPFSPERELFICTPDCQYLGHTNRINVPCRVDKDAVKAEMERSAKQWQRIAARVSGRHLNRMAEQAVQRRTNAALVEASIDQGLLTASAPTPSITPRRPSPESGGDDDIDAAIMEISGIN